VFWNWLFGNHKTTYTKEEIDSLIEEIKHFNAGAIDEYLSRHVDRVYSEWLTHRR
jgi:hypothetical protein